MVKHACNCDKNNSNESNTTGQVMMPRTDANVSFKFLVSQWTSKGGQSFNDDKSVRSYNVHVSEQQWDETKFVLFDVTKGHAYKITDLGFAYLDDNNLLQDIPIASLSKMIITIMNERLHKKIKQLITEPDFNADRDKTLTLSLSELFGSSEIDKLVNLIEKLDPGSKDTPYTFGRQKFLKQVSVAKTGTAGATSDYGGWSCLADFMWEADCY
jgi:hypothetical protein